MYFISVCGTIICGCGAAGMAQSVSAWIFTQKGRSIMIQKELNELRRRWRPEKNAVSRIYGCLVNNSREIVSDLNESLGMMPQEEAEKYLSFLKKGLSGTLGKNLIDIVFSTQQVADSGGAPPAHRAAGFSAEGWTGPAGLLPQGDRESGHGGEQLFAASGL